MSNLQTGGGSGDTERMAYKLREAAALLGLSPVTVRRLVGRGLLHPVRSLRHLVFARTELVRFLADNQ